MYPSTRIKIICYLLLIGVFLLPMSAVAAQDDQLEYQKLNQFLEIYQYLLDYHVDQPQAEQLLDHAIYGMIDSLWDPYTLYLTNQEYQMFLNSLDGSYTGVGIVLHYSDGGVRIQQVVPNSPAQRAGLQVGDLVTHIEGEEVDLWNMEEATANILGDAGTVIELTIKRTEGKKQKTLVYTMFRDHVTLPHVDLRMLDKEVGYIHLHRISSDSYSAMEKAIKDLESRGMQKLILDLRGNPGGMLEVTTDIASLFKEAGVVFKTKDSSGQIEANQFTKGHSFSYPLVVLIDEETASSAEVLAGFLQDYKLGTIMGQRSFGKGLVQSMLALEHGGVLKLSVQEYFTPMMKKVNGQGISPDHVVSNPDFQLAKAYGYLTGKNELALSAEGQLRLNGLIDDTLAQRYVWQEHGQVYLSLRLVSDWFGGQLTWDQGQKVITLDLDGQQYQWGMQDELLKVVQGRTYLPFKYVQEQLPFKVEVQQGYTVLKKAAVDTQKAN